MKRAWSFKGQIFIKGSNPVSICVPWRFRTANMSSCFTVVLRCVNNSHSLWFFTFSIRTSYPLPFPLDTSLSSIHPVLKHIHVSSMLCSVTDRYSLHYGAKAPASLSLISGGKKEAYSRFGICIHFLG